MPLGAGGREAVGLPEGDPTPEAVRVWARVQVSVCGSVGLGLAPSVRVGLAGGASERLWVAVGDALGRALTVSVSCRVSVPGPESEAVGGTGPLRVCVLVGLAEGAGVADTGIRESVTVAVTVGDPPPSPVLVAVGVACGDHDKER